MRERRVPWWLLLAVLPAAAGAEPQRFALDPVHSSVVFRVLHQGYSRSVGRIRIREGSLLLDPDDPAGSRVSVVLDAGSVDFGDEAWNRTMRGARWFAAGEHPEIRFVSDRVEAGPDPEVLAVHGTLELLGATHSVRLDVRRNRRGTNLYAGGRDWVGYSATATLSRSALGLGRDPGAAGDEVEVWIEVEAGRIAARKPGKR